MRKKFYGPWILLFVLTGFVFSQEQKPIDLIVVMDTSSSVYDSYHQVTEYAIGPLLKEFLRIGDTFHLISFSGAPRTELSRRIESTGDVETIIGRMLLMYPLDPYSDILATLEYVSRYLGDLPDVRPKTVIFISDGIQNPPPGSPYKQFTNAEVLAKINETANRLKGNGWTFNFVHLPLQGPAVSPVKVGGTTESAKTSSVTGKSTSGAIPSPAPSTTERSQPPATAEGKGSADSGPGNNVDVSKKVADSLNAPTVEWKGPDSAGEVATSLGALTVVFPQDLGKKTYQFTIPLRIYNPSPSKVYVETKAVLVDGIDRMVRRSFRELDPRTDGELQLQVELPNTYTLGAHHITVEPILSGNLRFSPSQGTMGLVLVESPVFRFIASILPFALFLIGLILAAILVLVILLISRRLHRAPNRAVQEATATVTGPSVTTSSRPVGSRSGAPASGVGATAMGAGTAVASSQAVVTPASPMVKGSLVGTGASAMGAEAGVSAGATGQGAALSGRIEPGAGIARANTAETVSRGGRDDHTAREAYAPSVRSSTLSPGPSSPAFGEPHAEALKDTSAKEGADLLAQFASRQKSGIELPLSTDVKRSQEPEKGPVLGARSSVDLKGETTLKVSEPLPYEVKKSDGRIMLSLFVEDQNTAIGRRNVHLLKAGHTLSLGGGRSDFLIFLVPIPQRIADIRFDGERCILVPRRPEFFPDNGSEPIVDCVNKTIRLVSQKGYELKIRLERFRDPLDTLNKFLHSIENPGR